MTGQARTRDLSAISETMLVTLYSHAVESHRPDGLILDPRAEELVARIDYDFAGHQMGADDQAASCLRLRQFDRFAQAFLAAHPDSVVVHEISDAVRDAVEALDEVDLAYVHVEPVELHT